MVNKNWFVISYCCAFIFVYLSSIAYAMYPAISGEVKQIEKPIAMVETYNMTMDGITTIGKSGILGVFSLIIIIAISLMTFSSFGMRSAL